MEDKVYKSRERTAAISEWVTLYTYDLLSWVFYKVSDKQLAEDLVQDTFLAAFQSFDKFQRKSEPKTWLLSILHNKIVDHYRKQAKKISISIDLLEKSFFTPEGEWREETSPGEWTLVETDLLDDPEFNNVLKDCLEKLSPVWLSVLRLKYFQQKNSKEICQDLGISPSNCWQMLCRAKLQIRACIEKKWFSL